MSVPAARARATSEGAELALIEGDLAQLTSADRLLYYQRVCESMGLNPLTKPFAYIHLNGKLQLYAKREATDQLRRIHGVSIDSLDTGATVDGSIFRVTAKGHDKQGRSDVSVGAVSIKGLHGEALANALMKAETKAKRRLTLSLVGLGWLDEDDVDALVADEIGPVQERAEPDAQEGGSVSSPPSSPPSARIPQEKLA